MGEGLTVRELAEIGLCRIRIEPSLWVGAMKAVKGGGEDTERRSIYGLVTR
jgi:hypothetical protein